MERGRCFKKKNKKNKSPLLVIFFSIFILALGYLIIYFYNYNKNKNLYENTIISEEELVNTETENMLKVKKLQEENADVKGWIQIEDTSINYPLLQGTDNEFYIKNNYKKEEDKYGSIMINKNSDLKNKNSNVIIYGHNMLDDKMFQNLLKYTDKSFYDEHSIVKITTEEEEMQYQIMYAFKSRVFYKSEKNVFRYYQYYNFDNENQYNEYLENCKKIQLYDTGVSATYGEQILTLITCEYSQENGRMVVVAKRIQ